MRRGKTSFYWSVVLVLVLCITAPVTALAQTAGLQIFVNIDVIPGESTNANHINWIDAFAYSIGVTHPASVGSAGGAGASKPEFSPVTIVKQIDKASPKLYETCAKGTRIKKVTIDFYEGGAKVLVVLLADAFITSVEAVTPELTSMPAVTSAPISVLQLQEKLSLTFSRISWTYYPAKGGSVQGCWDVASGSVRCP